MKYKYQKKWKDTDAKLEAEGEPVDWFDVEKSEVVKRVTGVYKDVELVFESLHEGNTVNTMFSLFRAVKIN